MTPPPIWFLAMCTACGVVGYTLLTPTLPLVKTELGVSEIEVQKLLTVYLIALALGQLICGPVSDRIGRRPVVLAGTILYSIGALATLFSDSISVLVALRFIQGLGGAACTSMVRAMVNDSFERSEAARQMSTISIVLAIAPAMSLAFGGLLGEYAGWKGTMTAMLAMGFLLFCSALFKANETHFNRTDSINVASVFSAYRAVLTNREFLGWTVASGMQIGIFFSLNSFLAYQYQRNGYSLAEFGMWFALTPLSYLIGNSCNRRWLVAQGIERAAMIGCSLSLMSVVALFITQYLGMTHALALALPCSLFGFSNGIIVANSTIGAISAAGKHAGTGSGIVGAWQMATGGIAGAIIVALGGTRVFSVAALGLIVMSVISVLAISSVYRQRHHRKQR